MGRKPLYGGERGIRSREQDVINKLFETAQADFYHDFGENVPERDKFTNDDRQRFIEIAQGYGISKVNAIVTGFNEVVGSNPFKLVRSSLPSKIFPSIGTNRDFMDENSALRNLGIDYEGIKKQFKSEIAKAKESGTYGTSALRIPDVTFTLPGGETRTYEVSGVVMKDKEGAGTYNIASRFELVTGGKSNIALVIDASGGLSMTSLVNTDLEPLPNNKMNIYILENIENDSDSATKLKTLDKPKDATRTEQQPNVVFLQDETDTVLYPNFKLDKAENDGELLFGNANLVLSRAGDEMEADFTFADGTTHHIENVSQNANVKNASLNILASALAEGGVVRGGEIVVPEGVKKPFLFPYIKRVGDWCQALSLLDGTRKYKMLDVQHTPTGQQTSLDELRKQDTAIGLLTLDRILLGYALTLGIDVFFTTATDLRLLLYFHNKETQLTDEELQVKLGELKAVFDAEIVGIGKDNVAQILDEAVAYVLGSTTNTDYIRRLRGALYRVSTLRTDFAVLTSKIKQLQEIVNPDIVIEEEEASIKDKYLAYFEAITILKKLKADEIHNDTQRRSFSSYPAFVEEKPTLDMIASRPQSRGAVAKLKVILSKEIFNDALQTKKIFETYGKADRLAEFVSVEVKEPNVDVFQYIFTSLNEVRALFGAPQRGGSEDDLDALKQFVVTPVDFDTYYQKTQQPPVDEPLPLILNTYYRDKKSLPYSVVNEYIITKEDLPIFQRILASGDRRTPEDEKFIATRLMLLYADILQGELEGLVASEDEEDDETPSSVKDIGHKRIYYKASQLQDIVQRYIATQNWNKAFQEAFNTYEGAELLDNETIEQIAVGRDGLRNPKDYGRTFQKLQTIHSALAYILQTPSSPSKVGVKRRREGGLRTESRIEPND